MRVLQLAVAAAAAATLCASSLVQGTGALNVQRSRHTHSVAELASGQIAAAAPGDGPAAVVDEKKERRQMAFAELVTIQRSTAMTTEFLLELLTMMRVAPDRSLREAAESPAATNAIAPLRNLVIVAQQLLDAWTAAQQQFADPADAALLISDAFLRVLPFFAVNIKQYYIASGPLSSLLSTLRADPDQQAFFSTMERDFRAAAKAVGSSTNDGTGIAAAPFQPAMRYSLTIKEMRKGLPESSDAYQQLTRAEAALNLVNAEANVEKAAEEDVAAMEEAQARFGSSDSIVAPGRWPLKHGTLKFERSKEAYLFSDMLAFRIGGLRKAVASHRFIPIVPGATATPGEGNTITFTSGSDTVIATADNEADQDAWAAEFNKAVTRLVPVDAKASGVGAASIARHTTAPHFLKKTFAAMRSDAVGTPSETVAGTLV